MSADIRTSRQNRHYLAMVADLRCDGFDSSSRLIPADDKPAVQIKEMHNHIDVIFQTIMNSGRVTNELSSNYVVEELIGCMHYICQKVFLFIAITVAA